MNFLSSQNLSILERSLQASSLRQKVIANNIANVNTPKFKVSDVSFEHELKKSLEQSNSEFVGYRTDPRHISIGHQSIKDVYPRLQTIKHTSTNNNQNNVDIDFEMSKLAKNQLQYNTLVTQINHHFSQLQKVITER